MWRIGGRKSRQGRQRYGDASQPAGANWNPMERPARIYARAVVMLNLAGITGRTF